MQYLPKLQDFMKALEQNRVFACEDAHFIGFKYNEPTVISRDWDDVTLNARGIVFDKATGDIVARPFFKFFNYQELVDGEGKHTDIYTKSVQHGFIPDFSLPFRVMDKLDGSLGIIFWDKYAGRWRVKTGGSFDSDQAKWAQQWFDEHVDTRIMLQSFTYCVEILCKEDVHPISYEKEELVLLSVISNLTGDELLLGDIKLFAEKMGIRYAEVIEFKNFEDVIPYATNLPKDKEGVVVTFQNGFKVKLKGKEFLELQKVFHNLTEKNIWKTFECAVYAKWDGNIEELNESMSDFNTLVDTIPEELPDVKHYAESLLAGFLSLIVETANTAIEIMNTNKERKDMYQAAVKKAKGTNLSETAIMACISAYTSNCSAYKDVTFDSPAEKYRLFPQKARMAIYRSLKPETKEIEE